MRHERLGILLLPLLLLFACEGAESGVTYPLPQPGDTSFYSADTRRSSSPGQGDDGVGRVPAPGYEENDPGAGGEGGERSVEEGDVYRMAASGLLLNLNPYRGLQVIDVSNPDAPAIVGRLQVSGTPVELYTSGDRAYLLLNDWTGYWGSRDDIRARTHSGGVVLSVDLTDPSQPLVLDRQVVPGWIYKSRLARGGGQEALYVVGQRYDEVSYGGGMGWSDGAISSHGASTRVESFAIGTDGTFAPAGSLDLGGWITDIAATPRALLVARTDYGASSAGSLVSVVDISRPDGSMIAGDEVRVRGLVRTQFNMDLHEGILRIVSGRDWSTGNANHLETFDATDLTALEPIDSVSFGAGEDLYATLFLGNAAFFVTYERQDPFHAFEIGPDGRAEEKSQFIVSGWNDFFRPVFGDSHLIGIGVDDQAGRTMAVSLYDIRTLTNPHPLVARQQVALDWSSSAANWDHRAFSVLEGAVSLPASDGTVETGLVLLPFHGWDYELQRPVGGVQIFTFSNTTLTRRGLMAHGGPVERSFSPAPGTAANLSGEELRLFDLADPQVPVERARLALAPNYADLLLFGDHAVRLVDRTGWSEWAPANASLPATVEVIERAPHPDLAPAIARFSVPSGARLEKVGHLLVALSSEQDLSSSTWPYPWETTVQVFDLSNPAQPVARGTLVTQALELDMGGGWDFDDYDDFGGSTPPRESPQVGSTIAPYRPDYGWALRGTPIHPVGEALAFVSRQFEQQRVGYERVCHASPIESRNSCYYDDRGEWRDGCQIVEGWETCVHRGGTSSCQGGFSRCTWQTSSGFTCEPVERSSIRVATECRDRPVVRQWHRFVVQTIDLRDPDAPALGAKHTSPRSEEAVSILPQGTALWLSYKVPSSASNEARPYVRYYAKRIDLARPERPEAGPAINLPGELLAIEGPTVFTRDQQWGARQMIPAIARLELRGDLAVLEAHVRFPDEQVETVALDGAGQLLVSHRPSGWSPWLETSGLLHGHRLTVLDASSSHLARLASVEVDDWATLRDVRLGRALFEVPGGLIVFNLDQPAHPWPQAYFATAGWPSSFLVEGRDIYFAAGLYGLYRFDLDETNLDPAP